MDLTVLIAEDEPKLRAVLCDYFKSRGDTPVSAGDGETALMLAEHGDYDAVLLDVMMPGLDGFAVCRALRRQSAVPILFLTALGDEEDQIRGFALGADDYITKPFSLPVLHAKVSALVARSRGGAAAGAGDILTCGPIAVRLTARRVTVEGSEIALTPKEFDLLVCLMRSRVQIARDRVELGKLTKGIFEKLSPLARERGSTVTLDWESEFFVTADEGRLGQAVQNFASNAVKYTPEGGQITVTIRRDRKEVRLSVWNSLEAPLSEEVLAKVWEPFFRADESRTARGTGLGLAITKQIVTLHGGSVSVRSMNDGVQFTMTLPG